MTVGPPLENVRRYGYVPSARPQLFTGERVAFDRVLKSGMHALDLGSGAGRITRELLVRGLSVCACDVIEAAAPAGSSLDVVRADARALPFADSQFDAVVFAFNGLDRLSPEAERVRALAEIARVLKPGGAVVLSSHKPVGTLFTRQGATSSSIWRWRLRYASTGTFPERYAADPSGVVAYQAAPRRVVRQVRDAAGLHLELLVGATGLTTERPLLAPLSPRPYYVFRKER